MGSLILTLKQSLSYGHGDVESANDFHVCRYIVSALPNGSK